MNLRKPFASLVLEPLEGRENPAPIGYSIQSDGDNQLYQIDLGTGVATAIGPTGITDIEGLSFNPTDGLLYGIDDAASGLVTINITTGVATLVATTGMPINNDPGLAFDAAGNLYAATDSTDSLYVINPVTGATTLIGSMGVDIAGLSFNPLDGVLYGVSEGADALYTINPTTAAATLVGATGLGFPANLGAGIDFDSSGVLWGLDDVSGIFQLNTTTGVGVITNAGVTGFESLAIQVTFTPPTPPPPPPPPPTPGPPLAMVLVAGSGAGQAGIVQVLDRDGKVVREFQPYASGFTGGVNVASGDVTGDGVADIITAPASAGGADIRVYDGSTGGLVAAFLAYDARFDGGASVAVGDVDGDGVGDIITGAGAGGGPHVRVFKGKTFESIKDFLAYQPKFSGGVSVAAADFDRNSYWDIVTGAGSDGGAHIRIFTDGDRDRVTDYLVANPAYRGGVDVAAGDFDGNFIPELAVGASSDSARVMIFKDGSKTERLSFDAYPGFNGGVRVGYIDPDGDGIGSLVTAPGAGGGANLRVFGLPNLDPTVNILLSNGSGGATV